MIKRTNNIFRNSTIIEYPDKIVEKNLLNVENVKNERHLDTIKKHIYLRIF